MPRLTFCLIAALAAAPTFADKGVAAALVPPSGVIGIANNAMLGPDFWIKQSTQPDQVLLDTVEIGQRNADLLKIDPSMHDLHAMPAQLDRATVTGWINDLSQYPKRKLYDIKGQPVPGSLHDQLTDALALDAVPAQQPSRYGMIVQRAALRTFPTDTRVFTSTDDTDIDRFQETAEFPGTPVLIAHTSRDGRWLFVVSPRYAAWTHRENVAEGTAADVLAYGGRTPYRVVTGSTIRTVFTPELPAVSQLQLDMGIAVPVVSNQPADEPVNGQSPYASYVVDLPIRQADGKLAFSPALIQRNADTQDDFLPLTEANIIRQAFKFLGERYGWGHDYDGRDCSGFVSDVYRSLGVQMPRNTSKQAISPGFTHQAFGDKDSHDERLKAAMALKVGDLVYIPGHVMMVIGKLDGEPYVIHDTSGISYRDGTGGMRRVKLNEVSVTPLLPLMYDDKHTYVDRMTSIVHVRP
ncbi:MULTISPECIES: SH3 domain-containing protein [unclassified Dyella]|uniref:C40 family peptidase n=1 Tax=unclassified Dyella TaxID=2634549 RepID=UPI000C81DF15|nr:MULTISPECIES: SH3 domain-containing protein [unclassified Dyella]MDR3447253.1 SH3 domain-containing protein [Dyella sp.]